MRTSASIILAIVALSGADAQDIWEARGDSLIEEAVAVSPSEFSEQMVINRCKAYLRAHPADAVLRYLIATDAQEALNELRGPGVTDISFLGWRQSYLQQPKTIPPTAELVRVGGRASARLRLAGGRIIERVLENASPFEATFRGEKVRIPGIALLRKNLPGGRIADGVEFFVQTARPWDRDLARSFYQWLRGRVPIPRVEAFIEDGWWFAGEPSYPIYNRFTPYLQPPTLEEFKTHARFHCMVLGGNECVQQGPARN